MLDKFLFLVVISFVLASCSDDETTSTEPRAVATLAGAGVGCTNLCPKDPLSGPPDGQVSVNEGYVNGTLEQARFNKPSAAVVDENIVYVADTHNGVIRMVDMNTKKVDTLAGRGTGHPAGECQEQDDGSFSCFSGRGYVNGDIKDARFNTLTDLALDRKNKIIYVADGENFAIRALDLNTNKVSTIAGPNPEECTDMGEGKLSCPAGYINGVGSEVRFDRFSKFFLDESENKLYIPDSNNQVIRVLDIATKEVSTLAGPKPDGLCVSAGSCFGKNMGYKNGSFENALFELPFSLVKDGDTIYVVEGGSKAVRVLNLKDRVVSSLTGKGSNPAECDATPPDEMRPPFPASFVCPPDLANYVNGSFYEARFSMPVDIEMDDEGNLLIADSVSGVAPVNSSIIRKVDLEKGEVSTLVGSEPIEISDSELLNTQCSAMSTTPGTATLVDICNRYYSEVGYENSADPKEAKFFDIQGITLYKGRIYVSDMRNHVVRRIVP